MSVKILHGDCLAILPTLAADSIDAVVTDPPYGLEFMGKEWDKIGWQAGGGFSKPGIGERETEWASFSATSRFGAANPTCECGGRLRGAKRCSCAEPKWKPIGKRRNPENEGLPNDMTGGGMSRHMIAMQEWHFAWAVEALRVLKPGGHLLAFGGSRTYHRMACAVEDAGFEIRDQIQWLYGSGFPKSRNIGRGRGTALKPAHEPIVLARKPLIGTVATNAERHGTGALNIDACRIGDFVNETPPGTDRYNQANFEQGYRPSAYRTNGREGEASAERTYADKGATNFAMKPGKRRSTARPQGKDIRGGNFGGGGKDKRSDLITGGSPLGRWPANVITDGSDEIIAAFPESGGQQGDLNATGRDRPTKTCFGDMAAPLPHQARNDSGSAARFFYTAKADKDDRLQSKHPTVKPVDLIAYLCRLITPPKGTVLDPFAGSGTTGMACLREGLDCILIEREAEYVADIERRVAHVSGTDSPLFSAAK